MTDDGQLELVPATTRRAAAPRPAAMTPRPAATTPRPTGPAPVAATRPVARLVVDTPLAHLDRLFDYAVPAALDADVVPGCRVKVRFAGRLTDAFVVGRGDDTSHEGTLAPIAKVVSSEPVLTPEVLGLCREVADRWAGTLNDVLRLAVPPRHAAAEARPRPDAPPEPLPALDDDAWTLWPDGPRLLSALADGGSPRVVWGCLPDRDPARGAAEAVLATLRSGRGAVVCVPDQRDAAHWDRVLAEVLGPGRHVLLTAGQKPAARYKAFLAASRGDVQVVLGTRAAAFAPVRDLGLVVTWDDGDDLFVEPRAPYLHIREVLLTRAAREGAGVLLAGFARSVEAQSLVASGWCAEVVPETTTRRLGWPTVHVTDGSVAGGAPARLPHQVFEAVRSSDGAVLVQVPRRGYRASLACQDCRTPARCAACHGPLAQAGPSRPPACRWCGTAVEPPWTCPECGGHRLRSPVVGQLRTAEEYARAFPEHEVVTSGGATVLERVEPGRRIVLATPGAEPRVEGGYPVVVLMDTWLLLARDAVDVVGEAHRRWFNALALGRERGQAIAVGDPATLQALVRADPASVAARELDERAATHLPPVARLVTVDAPDEVVDALAARRWTPAHRGPRTRPGR
ncbi:MAG: primosome assembly protein PriA [Aeromicrobium erythreum]